MYLVINGEKYPSDGLHFNFKKRNPFIAQGYQWMYHNTGAYFEQKGNIVSPSLYAGGNFLVPFDLCPHKCNNAHYHRAVEGYIDLVAKFDQPLLNPIFCVYEFVYPSLVLNDKVLNEVVTVDIKEWKDK